MSTTTYQNSPKRKRQDNPTRIREREREREKEKQLQQQQQQHHKNHNYHHQFQKISNDLNLLNDYQKEETDFIHERKDLYSLQFPSHLTAADCPMTSMKISPFSNSRISCSSSTFHSGQTSHACSLTDSFYSHEAANELVGKFEATPYKRNLDFPEDESALDPNESFVSQMSSPSSPPNFYQIIENNKGDEISPVRPDNEKGMGPPTFNFNPKMRLSRTKAASPTLEANSNQKINSPCIIPNRSVSPMDLKSNYEKRKKSYSLQQDIGKVDLNEVDQIEDIENKHDQEHYDDFGLKLVSDEYSSMSSSISSTEDIDFSPSLDKSMKKLSKSSLQSSASSVSVLRICPDSPQPISMSTSRTLFCDPTPEKNKSKRDLDEEVESGLLLHCHKGSLTPTQISFSGISRLQTNQHHDRLETTKEHHYPQTPTAKSLEMGLSGGSRARKQRVKSLPPSYTSPCKTNDMKEEGSNFWQEQSTGLLRSQSHNKVLTRTESTPMSNRYPIPRPRNAITSPERLTSQILTPSTEAINLPYHLLHSPPPSSPSTRGVCYGFHSPRSHAAEESWTECKSLFPLDDGDPIITQNQERRQSLSPPRVTTTPSRFLKQREDNNNSYISTPDKRSVRSNSGDNYLSRSSDSNVGKRSRSPFSSAGPSPTEQHQHQHQKFDNNEITSSCSSICSGITNQMNNTSISSSSGNIRPLPDQSVFEATRTNSFHATHSPICPPTPARSPQYIHQDDDLGIKRHVDYTDTMFLLRTSDSNEFDSPRPHLFRQNSLEENKLLMTSEPSPIAQHDHHDTGGEGHLSQHSNQNESHSSDTMLSGHDTSQESTLHDISHPTNILFYRDFVNEGLMGSGTFAEVFRVSLKSDPDQKFAIKKCRKKFRNKSERENLLNEVRCMKLIGQGAVKCPNVLQFFNAWQEDSYFYVQLELAERGTLRDLMNLYFHKKSFLPHFDILNIFFQITSGLKHIHSYHIVHLDIKPQNILITTDGTLKIGDFGIAMHEGPDGDERHEGDTRYLPEELLNSSHRDYTADIFSLGLSIYEICLVPQLDILPYGGDLWHDLRSGKITDITLPEHGNRPAGLVQLILSCIAPSPSLRPTAEQILAHPDFDGEIFPATNSILCEPPLRAPSPAIFHPSPFTINNSIDSSRTNPYESQIVATPTSSGGISSFHRMLSPYMFSNTNPDSTPTNHHSDVLQIPPTRHKTPGVEENIHSFLPYTPTMQTFPLSEFFKTSPRHFLSHEQYFLESPSPDQRSSLSVQSSIPTADAPPSTPQSHSSQFSCPTVRRTNPGLSISTSQPEAVQTPTSHHPNPFFPITPISSLQNTDHLSTATPTTNIPNRKHGRFQNLSRKKK